MYYQRFMEQTLLKVLKQFPATVVTGPRQSGKSTMLKNLLGSSYRYFALDSPTFQANVMADPDGFFDRNPPPMILDEVQNVPQLLNYIKLRIDNNRSAKGQFVLSGSQNLLLLSTVTESLAGRVAILKLYPMTIREQLQRKNSLAPWETDKPDVGKNLTSAELWQRFIRGNYPQLIAEPEFDANLWYANYIQTYLERDVRSIRQIADLMQFQVFLQLVAARSGQQFNLTLISNEIGISIDTVRKWLSILEATHQIFIVRPYYVNTGKRLVKQPKIYFTDSGLLCYLIGVRTPEQAISSPLCGAIVETAVLGELQKYYFNTGLEKHIYYYRTSHGVEVDFVIELYGKLIPIEVKSTSTPVSRMAKSVHTFLSDYRKVTDQGWIIHLGNQVLPMGPGVIAVPFSAI